MTFVIDKYSFDIDPITCPLKEISLKNYLTKPLPRERRGRRKAHPTTDSQSALTPVIPLELDESSATSYTTYQDALAAAIEILLNPDSSDEPTIDNLIIGFSYLSYFDVGSQSFKTPGRISPTHLAFIFENSKYFTQRYEIRENVIYRK